MRRVTCYKRYGRSDCFCWCGKCEAVSFYEKEWRGPMKQVADAAITDVWRLWWRFESCVRELFNKKPGQAERRRTWSGHSRSWVCFCGTVLVWLCWKGSWSCPLQVAAVWSPVSRQKPTAEYLSPLRYLIAPWWLFFLWSRLRRNSCRETLLMMPRK